MEVLPKSVRNPEYYTWEKGSGNFVGPKIYDPQTKMLTWDQKRPATLTSSIVFMTGPETKPWTRRDITQTITPKGIMDGYNLSSNCGSKNQYTFTIRGEERDPQLHLQIHTFGGIGPVNATYGEDGMPGEICVDFSFQESRIGKGILFTPDMVNNEYLGMSYDRLLERFNDLIRKNNLGVLLPGCYFGKSRKEALKDLQRMVSRKTNGWTCTVSRIAQEGSRNQVYTIAQEYLKGSIRGTEITECEEYLALLVLLHVPEYFSNLPPDLKKSGDVFQHAFSRAAGYILEYNRLHLEYLKKEQENDFSVDMWRSGVNHDAYILSYPITRIDGSESTEEQMIEIDGVSRDMGIHRFTVYEIRGEWGMRDSIALHIQQFNNKRRGAQIILPVINYNAVVDGLKDPGNDHLKEMLQHIRPDFVLFQ